MQFLQSLPDIINFISAISQPLLALLGVVLTWKAKGYFDFKKTMDAVQDVGDVIEDHEVVEKIEKLRGKKLPKRLREKAIARFKTLKAAKDK